MFVIDGIMWAAWFCILCVYARMEALVYNRQRRIISSQIAEDFIRCTSHVFMGALWVEPSLRIVRTYDFRLGSVGGQFE